jgi:hypothetical protein
VHTDTSLPITGAVVGLHALNKPGRVTLTLRGEVLVPTPFSPALDPSQDGVRVQLVNANDGLLDSLDLPAGMRDATHPVGWSTNRSRQRWHYTDQTGAGRVRTAQLLVDDISGHVGVRLTASRGVLTLTRTDAPLGIRMLVSASPSRCGALMFNPLGVTPPTCKFSHTGSSVQCR